ncbi:hypothetical protein ACE1BS_06715, partial [Aeromonas jandaei]
MNNGTMMQHHPSGYTAGQSFASNLNDGQWYGWTYLAEEEQQSPLLTPMLASAAHLKLPVLPLVGPIYIGMWVI